MCIITQRLALPLKPASVKLCSGVDAWLKHGYEQLADSLTTPSIAQPATELTCDWVGNSPTPQKTRPMKRSEI